MYIGSFRAQGKYAAIGSRQHILLCIFRRLTPSLMYLPYSCAGAFKYKRAYKHSSCSHTPAHCIWLTAARYVASYKRSVALPLLANFLLALPAALPPLDCHSRVWTYNIISVGGAAIGTWAYASPTRSSLFSLPARVALLKSGDRVGYSIGK